MKKILFAIIFILLTACQKEEAVVEHSATNPLSPFEIAAYDYDSFILNGKTYRLPASYEDFADNGLVINQNEYFHDSIRKNQQMMTNLVGDGYDLSATFKNTTDEPISTIEGTVIEVYVNSFDGKNEDFSINGLSWGDSFTKASKRLNEINKEVAIMNNNRTLNYYTDKNYVSLYFSNDKLTSAAIFAKSFMRDENYVAGEFVIFGQTVEFPLTIRDLEELLMIEFDLSTPYLEAGEEIEITMYSPLYESDSEIDATGGLDVIIKNKDAYAKEVKDCEILSIKTDNSPDLSVGNIYIGASIEELKKMDKKNQNPKRLNILQKDKEEVKFSFEAENNTTYLFKSNRENITEIEIINKEQ